MSAPKGKKKKPTLKNNPQVMQRLIRAVYGCLGRWWGARSGRKEPANRRMEGGQQWFCSLLLLGLFAGCFCGTQDPMTTAAEPLNISLSDEGTAATPNITLGPKRPGPVSGVKTMKQDHLIKVAPVRASRIAIEGHRVSLKCEFTGPSSVNVNWKKSCSPNCSQIFNAASKSNPNISVEDGDGSSTLFFSQAKIEDSGMYYCIVRSFDSYDQSCGTYLWVRRPRPTSFLNIRESVKNKIITVEGFLLLICAIGPGLFLLLRKRWENKSLLEAKKKYEEENLYEGLNLDECSMYEDISRGLQATYQDIGNVKVIDLQLEKPEKP